MAAELVGCSHHTVAAHVAARDAGHPVGVPVRRAQVTDAFLPSIEGWVEKSKGTIRADRVHEKLVALGYEGSERSTEVVPDLVEVEVAVPHLRLAEW